MIPVPFLYMMIHLGLEIKTPFCLFSAHFGSQCRNGILLSLVYSALKPHCAWQSKLVTFEVARSLLTFAHPQRSCLRY